MRREQETLYGLIAVSILVLAAWVAFGTSPVSLAGAFQLDCGFDQHVTIVNGS